MGHLLFCFLQLGIGRAKPLSWFWGGGIWDCFNGWHVAFNKRLCFGACHAFGAFHLLPDRYRCDQRRSGF
jgi:hypothetical protein